MNNSSYHTVFKSMTFFAFFSPYKFEATTFTLIELKQGKCFSGLTFKKKSMLRQRIDEAHEWMNEIPSFHIYDTLWIAVITVEPAGKASFVLGRIQTRLMGQYNGKWPISLVYMSKPLITVIAAIGTAWRYSGSKWRQL